ncbi:class I SAM-dependent methyltransferase [Azospirillum sp.]|uniref:class I SAM-dependent methyltransferase n=1 Tax=Azospirillum sp. TaxID=34012 RepID=UPI003D75F889
MTIDVATKEFYDSFWPKFVPIYEETKKYMLETIAERHVGRALDAGCGHGICSVVLSELADEVTAVDISTDSLATARQQAKAFGRANITHHHQDLQTLDPAISGFDLVWCWGVAMMAPDPIKVMHNLMNATKPGGVVYLGLYLKTWLSPVHEAVRHFCRTFMNGPRRKQLVCDFFTALTHVACRLKGQEINRRADNVSIQAQVEDWYYPPYKTFYSIEEIVELFHRNGFEAECIQDRLGRMKSATIFVVRAVKHGG